MSALKILCGVKRVLDIAAKVRVKPDKSSVVTENVKTIVNPFDEIGVEAGLRLKEAGHAKELVVVSVGPSNAVQQLHTTLAMGADRGILVEHPEDLEPFSIAKIFHKLCEIEKPDLVILGKQAVDDDSNQTGQMLAGLLGWPQGTFISKLEKAKDKSELEITREVDGGLQVLNLKLPAVITCDLRLNEPRFATLPNIMKAKKKPLDKKTPKDLGVDITNHISYLSFEEPAARKAGVKVETVDELVGKLKSQGLI